MVIVWSLGPYSCRLCRMCCAYAQCSPTWTSNRIYSNPTHDKHQWLLLQFIVLLKMDAKGVRNMYSILVVFNNHNTARVASCWFIIYIYYRLTMHGNSNIKIQYFSFTTSPVRMSAA